MHSGSSLYIPRRVSDVDDEAIWQWFGNIPRELDIIPFSEDERRSVETYYRSAGLLTRWRREFFRHHYAGPLLAATRQLFDAIERPRILDLGAGAGTQSLLFALLGADVVAVDLDAQALQILEKRKALYEQQSGRRLSLEVRHGNVFEMDWASLGPFTGVYSLFAFNMMQPTKVLLELLQEQLATPSVMAIQDGNKMHFFNRLFRRRSVLSKAELGDVFRAMRFGDIRHVGGYAIPPLFWNFFPMWFLAPVDRALTRFDILAVSYLHLVRRGG